LEKAASARLAPVLKRRVSEPLPPVIVSYFRRFGLVREIRSFPGPKTTERVDVLVAFCVRVEL